MAAAFEDSDFVRAFQNAVLLRFSFQVFRNTGTKTSSRRSANGVYATERCRVLSYRPVVVNRLFVRRENQEIIKFVFFWVSRCRLTNYILNRCPHIK